MNARVLALLPLFFVLAHSFSWEIVVGSGDQLKFYNNGVLTHTEDIPSSEEIYSVTYDPVHFRVLFSENENTSMSISSFDLTTRKIQTLVTRPTNPSGNSLAYDPLTQLLFWNEDDEIYSISLKPASSNTTIVGKLVVTLDDDCRAIAVDSCGGYIYWTTRQTIERAAFDGSEREVLLDRNILAIRSLAIDQQTRKMYWSEEVKLNEYSIESADLNGKNRRTFYFIGAEVFANALAVSKDFIYWKSYDQRAILQLPKNQQHGVAPIVYSDSSKIYQSLQTIAANYTIMEQTLGMKSCEALKSLISNSTVNVSLDGSPCHNYCLQGNCTTSAEGRPKCSCEAGYFGERCEVNACYKHCLHGGVCSLNEEEEPVCECTADYEGERCDVATSHTGVHAEYATEQIQHDLRREVKKVIKEELISLLLAAAASL